jgi:serine acetyltransferase
VINKNAKLGKGVHLRHGVTIGVRNMAQQNLGVSPVIGDNVEFGCYVSVLGDVKVSENVKLGAHSLVLRDVGPGEVFMGYSVRDY